MYSSYKGGLLLSEVFEVLQQADFHFVWFYVLGVCVFVHTCGHWYLLPYNLRHGLLNAKDCLCLPKVRVTCMHRHACLFTRLLGIEIQVLVFA